MNRTSDFDLDAEEIVDAAIEILREDGLDAVSMRSVSSRLGVSPVPLYSRVGNKDALIGAMADRLLADVAPPLGRNERWDTYARRWARALRSRLSEVRDRRVIASPTRTAFVEATRPLVDALRRDGFDIEAAIHACRLLTWATVGFASVETGVEPPPIRSLPRRPGGDATGVAPAEVDEIFVVYLGYLIDGIRRDHAERTDP